MYLSSEPLFEVDLKSDLMIVHYVSEFYRESWFSEGGPSLDFEI